MDLLLCDSLRMAPVCAPQGRHWDELSALQLDAVTSGYDALASILAREPVANLIAGVFAGSPYLRGLITRDLARLQRILAAAPQIEMERLCDEAAIEAGGAADFASAMRSLRRFKASAALLVALSDLGGVWSAWEWHFWPWHKT